jgi:benzoate-CoA ligase
METRVLVCLLDTIDFPAVFLGAIKAGLVPIAVNTLLTSSDFDFLLRDSRAGALVLSEPLLPAFEPILNDQPFLKHVIVSGENSSRHPLLAELIAKAQTDFTTAPTHPDDACFWLYSSGSTGTPKGVVHVQTSMMRTAELYAHPILGAGLHSSPNCPRRPWEKFSASSCAPVEIQGMKRIGVLE